MSAKQQEIANLFMRERQMAEDSMQKDLALWALSNASPAEMTMEQLRTLKLLVVAAQNRAFGDLRREIEKRFTMEDDNE